MIKRIVCGTAIVGAISAFLVVGCKHDMNRQLPASQEDYPIATTCENVATSCDVAEAETEYLIPSYDYSFIVTEAPTTEPLTTEAPTTEAPTEPGMRFYDVPLSQDMQEAIYSIAESYGISYELILAVIKVESNFHCDSIGDNGKAIGFMQIQPQWWQGTADELGLNIYEPIDNIRLGVHILASHLNACGGDLTQALIKYNTGLTESDTGRIYAFRVYEAMFNITGGGADD